MNSSIAHVITFDEWASEHGQDVEREWEYFESEYGDLAPLLSSFKEQRYNEFLEKTKIE